ncbi:hypothetical protein [Martelella sp.]|uniref:hypothetical protein n=1 Tax=Martelella sp. TaxID=1969699 RepID=UPI0025C173A7|nr:hypothetical protein [Martelella sp.]
MRDEKTGIRCFWKRLQLEGLFVTGLASGVLISIAVASAIALFSAFAGDPRATPTNPLYHYQTLITGIAAVLAAGASVWMVSRQITAEDRREVSRRQAKKDAAIAVAPLALAAICEYAERAASYVAEFQSSEDVALPESETPKAIDVVFPFESLTSLKELIEFVDEVERAPLMRLIADLQVIRTRLRSDLGKRFKGQYARETVLRCAKIYARSSALLTYSRARGQAVPDEPEINAVSSALFSILWRYDDFRQEVLDYVEQKYSGVS